MIKTTVVSSDNSYSKSLLIKIGRNSNTTLYYVNQNKLPPVDHERLVDDLAKSSSRKFSLVTTLNDTLATTATLISQPTNTEVDLSLTTETTTMNELTERSETLRRYAVHEKDQRRTRAKTESSVKFWRVRKRKCIDFLENLEDMTEGSVSAKKCLRGVGPIDIDSDEAFICAALDTARILRGRMGGRMSLATGGISSSSRVSLGGVRSSLPPSLSCGGKRKWGDGSGEKVFDTSHFVGVRLGRKGAVQRVLVDGADGLE